MPNTDVFSQPNDNRLF